MDPANCVLLEAFKQFVDTTGALSLVTTPPVEDGEAQLEAMSRKSSARAKQLLTRLCRKKGRKPEAVPIAAARKSSTATPATTSSQSALAPVPAPSLPPCASMLLSTREAKLVEDKLTVSLSNLRAITKGRDYFSRDPLYAVEALKAVLDIQGSLSVILQAGSVMELRDVLDVRVAAPMVEFTLGDMQVADGGDLGGSLTDVQLFFGNLSRDKFMGATCGSAAASADSRQHR
jgi:hypothetical protein